MIFQLSDFTLCKGAFSVVMIDKNSKKAYKLFISYNHPNLNGTCKEEIGEFKTNEYRKKVFKTEIKAYYLVQKSSLLKAHTPKYFGVITADKVFDKDSNVTYQYLTDCCYKIEFIDGCVNKLYGLSVMKNLLEPMEKKLNFKLVDILKEFQQYKINYINDASVIYNDKEFKIIDFGTEDPNNFEPIN